MEKKDWVWQASENHTTRITAERAARLRAMGESVWPASNEDDAHVSDNDDD